ncbi:MAG: DUF5676 family membrane protein [Candidatus Paceibacterota bacterium]
MKLTKELLANAASLTTAVLWTLDTAFVYLFPTFSINISKHLFHGLPIQEVGNYNITAYGYIIGGVFYVVGAWIAGYIFGASLEYLSKKK